MAAIVNDYVEPLGYLIANSCQHAGVGLTADEDPASIISEATAQRIDIEAKDFSRREISFPCCQRFTVQHTYFEQSDRLAAEVAQVVFVVDRVAVTLMQTHIVLSCGISQVAECRFIGSKLAGDIIKG
jgi:hypothetical protein